MILKKFGNFVFHKSLCRYKEYNKDKLKNKNYILCPNHTSDLDGPVFWSSIENISIMAKKECFQNKIMANFFEKINVVSVDREKKNGSEMRQAIRYLEESKENNRIYMLFPQGTISDINKNTIKRIKPGAFYIADAAKVPIVPVFIEQPRVFKKSRIVYGNEIEVNIRDEKNKIDKEKLLNIRNLWKEEVLRLQQEAIDREKRPIRKIKLKEKHRNNNDL